MIPLTIIFLYSRTAGRAPPFPRVPRQLIAELIRGSCKLGIFFFLFFFSSPFLPLFFS
jgi:hypothetical protein